MDYAVAAAVAACSADVNLMSNDRLEALTKGHGMLNLAVFGAADVIIESLSTGGDIKVRNTDAPSIPLDRVMDRAITAAKAAGADSANAGLISAVLLYLAGSGVQAGVPVGNRKLGAMARMAAGVDRCGVAALPSPKFGNKVSGFPAVAAIYKAMAAGELTEVNGANLPLGVGALFIGHSALGEDYAFPQICVNAGRIGTEAMLKAMAGAAMRPDPFIAAVFGAAATLEIVHPDASVVLEDGRDGNTTQAVGAAAAKAAALPPTLTMIGLNIPFDTGQLIGDLGLILKDIGGATIPGMLCFKDIMSCFVEPVVGFRPTTPPLGHIAAEVVLAMIGLIQNGFQEIPAGQTVAEVIKTRRIDPEMGLIALNTVARKAEQVNRGPVTRLLIKTTDPYRMKGLHDRAERSVAALNAGKNVVDIVAELEQERQRTMETGAARLLSNQLGKQVRLEMTKIASWGRKKVAWAKFWVLDMDVDVKVTIADREVFFEGLPNKVVPRMTLNPKEASKVKDELLCAALPLMEACLAAHTTINGTVPAAAAAAMGLADPEEAANQAQKAAYLSGGVPGLEKSAKDAAERAIMIAQVMRGI
ncbi:hypothetical protein ACFLZM_04970 [Thermodesulfobacteriota bacterium]